MKNKIVVLYMLSLLLIPIATADIELRYDNGRFFGGLLINDHYSGRVRFTSTIGGELSQVELHWYNQSYCCDSGSKFFILVNYTGYTVRTGNYSVDCSGWQSIPISNFSVYKGKDFYVEVHSSEGDMCLSMAEDDPSVNRSEQYGYFPGEWKSVDEVLNAQNWPPCELAIIAIVTETSSTTTTTSTTSTTIPTTTTTSTTSTTIPEGSTTTTQPTTTTTRPSYTSTKRGGGGGGPYGPNRTKTCYDGIRNCHHGSCESGIDCGGPCLPCPSCFDGIQNQGEEGIDCGGPCEKPCPVIKVNVTTTTTTTTTIPEIKLPTECGEGCDRTPHPENPFPDCSSCIVALDCQSLCGVDNVCDSAQYCYKLGEDYYCGCCCQSTTTTTIETPQIVGRVVAFPPEGMAMIGIFILFPLLLFFLYKREKKKEREEG